MINAAAMMGSSFRVSAGGARDSAQRPDQAHMRVAQPLRSPVAPTQTMPPAPVQASGGGAASAHAGLAAAGEQAPLATDLLSSVFDHNQAALRAGVDASRKVFWTKVLTAAMTAIGTGALVMGALAFSAFGGVAIAAVAVSAAYGLKASVEACYSFGLWRNLKAAEAGQDPPFKDLDARFRALAGASNADTAAAVIQDGFALGLSALGVSPEKARVTGLVIDSLMGLAAGFLGGFVAGSWQNAPIKGALFTLAPLIVRTILSIASNSIDARRQAANEQLLTQLGLHASSLHDDWVGLRSVLLNQVSQAKAQNIALLTDVGEIAALEQRYQALSEQIDSQLMDIAQQFEARTGTTIGINGYSGGSLADAQASVAIGRADGAAIAMMAGSEHLSRLPEMFGVIPGYGGPALLMNAVMLVRTVNAWANLSATRDSNLAIQADSAEALRQARDDLATLGRAASAQVDANGWGAEFARLAQVPAQPAPIPASFTLQVAGAASGNGMAAGLAMGGGLINPNLLA